MPGLDRSGPTGAGSMTGGRRGLCGQSRRADRLPANDGVGYGRGLGFRRGAGRGFAQGRGRGRGFGRGFYMNPPADSMDAPIGAAKR